MAFTLDNTPGDIAAELRFAADDHPKLSPAVRSLLIAAADKLDDHKRLLEDVITELDGAAALKIGMMDSQSRADDVSRSIRGTLVGLSARSKELLAKPHAIPPRTKPDNSAVI